MGTPRPAVPLQKWVGQTGPPGTPFIYSLQHQDTTEIDYSLIGELRGKLRTYSLLPAAPPGWQAVCACPIRHRHTLMRKHFFNPHEPQHVRVRFTDACHWSYSKFAGQAWHRAECTAISPSRECVHIRPREGPSLLHVLPELAGT